MTLLQVFASAANMCGFANANLTPESFRNEALQMIHAALQLMQSAGEEYFARESISIPTVTGQSAYPLDARVQTVLDPVRTANGRSLRKLASRAEYLSFYPTYLGTFTAVSGTPLAYWIETTRAMTAGATPTPAQDSAGITLHVVPAPSEAYPTLLADVLADAPRYTTANLCDGTVPPVPHKYHESILLPLVRYNMAGTRYYRQPQGSAMLQSIQDDYSRALKLLGMANPDRDSASPAPQQLAAPRRQQQEAQQ